MIPLSASNILIARYHVSRFPKGAPWVRYHGNYKGLHIDLVWPGKDPVLGKFRFMYEMLASTD
jgi:hypothetical protein